MAGIGPKPVFIYKTKRIPNFSFPSFFHSFLGSQTGVKKDISKESEELERQSTVGKWAQWFHGNSFFSELWTPTPASSTLLFSSLCVFLSLHFPLFPINSTCINNLNLLSLTFFLFLFFPNLRPLLDPVGDLPIAQSFSGPSL